MITAPKGFRAAGVTAGLKDSGKPDLALVVNDGPNHVAAGVYTTNRIVAWPVTWTKAAVADGTAKAVVLNSGNANVATKGGMAVTEATAQRVADQLDIDITDVAVASTGVIGVSFTPERLVAGVDLAVDALSADGSNDAATAIMTTDTRSKKPPMRTGSRSAVWRKAPG